MPKMYAGQDNPLLAPVLAWLDSASLPAREYDLIQHLDSVLPGWPIPASEDAQLQLFRKHFLVMNALYQLQSSLREAGVHLQIDPLAINLVGNANQDEHRAKALHSDECPPAIDQQSKHLSEAGHAEHLLATYYLDWQHYQGADSASVQALFDGFWQRYHNQEHLGEARQVLGVDARAGWLDIQRAYRRQVKLAHPDNGGDARDFIRVRRAYEELKLHYS